MRHGEHERPLVDCFDRFHGGEEGRQGRRVRRVHDGVVDLFHRLRGQWPAGMEQPALLQDKRDGLPVLGDLPGLGEVRLQTSVRRIDQERIVERVERRVIPVGGHRIERGKIEVVALAQGAADHRLLLRQRRGRRFPGQKLTERGGGDSESRRLDQEITPGQTPRAVSREELMNGDAGIHLNASL